MRNLSSELLSMTDEPAALFQNRRLVYLNNAARAILGADCAGQSLRLSTLQQDGCGAFAEDGA